LQQFAMVPVRVAADRRLGEWDLRVLIALLGMARWDKERERMEPLRIRAATVVRILEAEMPSARALVQRSLRRLEELEYLRRRAPEGRAGTYDLGPTWWAGAVDNLLKRGPGEGELPFGVITVECAVPRTVELAPPPKARTVECAVTGGGRRGETRQTVYFIEKTRPRGLSPGETPRRRPSESPGAKALGGLTARRPTAQTTHGRDACATGPQTRHPFEGVPSMERCNLVVGTVGVSRGGFLSAVRTRPDLSAAEVARSAERFAARATPTRPRRPDRAWAGWLARERGDG